MQNIIVLCRHCESPISFSFFRFRFGPHEYCHPTAPTLSSKAGRLLLGRPHLLLSRRRTSIAIQAAEGVVRISSSLGGARVLPSKLHLLSPPRPDVSFPGRTGVELHFISSIQEGSASDYYMYVIFIILIYFITQSIFSYVRLYYYSPQ